MLICGLGRDRFLRAGCSHIGGQYDPECESVSPRLCVATINPAGLFLSARYGILNSQPAAFGSFHLVLDLCKLKCQRAENLWF